MWFCLELGCEQVLPKSLIWVKLYGRTVQIHACPYIRCHILILLHVFSFLINNISCEINRNIWDSEKRTVCNVTQLTDSRIRTRILGRLISRSDVLEPVNTHWWVLIVKYITNSMFTDVILVAWNYSYKFEYQLSNTYQYITTLFLVKQRNYKPCSLNLRNLQSVPVDKIKPYEPNRQQHVQE